MSYKARTQRKLNRLGRDDAVQLHVDEDGKLVTAGLSTQDPLLCEVMIANTLSNLAVADAIEKAAVMHREDTHYLALSMPGRWNFDSMRDERSREGVVNRFLKALDGIDTRLKELIKAVRK